MTQTAQTAARSVRREYLMLRETEKAVILLGGEVLPKSQITFTKGDAFERAPHYGAKRLVTVTPVTVFMPEWLRKAKFL